MTGVSIIDMSIEDVVITNPELAKAMSQAAVSATKLDSARIEVEERRMRAQGEARSMQILATVSERREERNNIEISFVTLSGHLFSFFFFFFFFQLTLLNPF